MCDPFVDAPQTVAAKETQAYNAAHALHEKDLLALHKMEADLVDAEKKLRTFRKMGA